MRWLFLLCLLAPSVAHAQFTERCEGQTWSEIAAARYDEARLGPLLAIHNRAAGTERCKAGRFVRLVSTIQHEVRLGQTLDAIVSRFYRAPGAAKYLRDRFQLPQGTEPGTGRILALPVELAIAVGSRPEEDLAALFGIPPLGDVKAFNGVADNAPLPKGTVYVPVTVTPKSAPVAAPPPPPPPPKDGSPPPPPPPEKTATKANFASVPFIARFDRFRHPQHAAVTNLGGCKLCHVADPAEPHTYLPIAEKTCTSCHTKFEATAPGARTDRLTLTFSHDLHLADERTVKQDGYEVGCGRCHQLGSNVREPPGHKTCVACHNPSEVKPSVQEDCAGCHAVAEVQDRLTLAKLLLAEHYRQGPRATDIRFEHASHLPDDPNPAFVDVACDGCHEAVKKSDSLEEVEPIRMADCLECHQGMVKELGDRAVRLDRCAVCHVQTRVWSVPSPASLLDDAPSHGPGFNRRHEAAALADDGACATCHVELSGGDGANCQRCHERVRPRDHTVRWREEPHGRASVRDPERCATCHARERCIDCHEVAPRSHFPRASFRTRHGRAAQRSIRSCQTCHVPQVDCARCHDVTGT